MMRGTGDHARRRTMVREGARNAELMRQMTPEQRRAFTRGQLINAVIATLVLLGIVVLCAVMFYFVRSQ